MKRSWFTFQNVGLMVVVLATLFASLQSQRAVNKVSDQNAELISQSNALASQQKQIIAVSTCTQQVLFRAIDALGERTQNTGAQAAANIDLQRSQLHLFLKGLNPETSQEERERTFQNYVRDLQNFLTIASEVQNVGEHNPYPTPEQYLQCLTDALGVIPDELNPSKSSQGDHHD